MAKDLVRTRSHVQKMIKMKTQLQAVSLRLQTVKSQNAMASAIKGVARVRLSLSPHYLAFQSLLKYICFLIMLKMMKLRRKTNLFSFETRFMDLE